MPEQWYEQPLRDGEYDIVVKFRVTDGDSEQAARKRVARIIADSHGEIGNSICAMWVPQPQESFTFPPDAIRLAVARSKREILLDIARGTVPADVPDFSTLHNYVDANVYGGLCDGLPYDGEELCAFGNAVQGEVDKWLRARSTCVVCGESLTAFQIQFLDADTDWLAHGDKGHLIGREPVT